MYDHDVHAGERLEGDINMKLGHKENMIFTVLKYGGYEAYIVGGAVRDHILQKEIKDYDFTTNAKPNDVISLFRELGYRVVPTGIEFGTVTVMIGGEGFEITTFRTDGEYINGRKPEDVTFSKTLESDLQRRDFTMNSLVYTPGIGILDLFGGMKDMENKSLVAVGEADKRISEDYLRALRAIRFSNKYEMVIEESLEKAIRSHLPMLKLISKERIFAEVTKTLISAKGELVYADLLAEILYEVFPEFKASFGITQNHPYHTATVGGHTLKVVASTPPVDYLKWAALLHDMGKLEAKVTDENGIDHFPGHHEISTIIAERVLKSLKAPNRFIDKVKVLILSHDRQIEPTAKSVRKLIASVGSDNVLDVLALKKADIMGQSSDFISRLEDLDKIAEIFNSMDNPSVNVKDLAIDGKDLITLGFKTGPAIGDVLNKLLQAVIDNPDLNNRTSLLKMAQAV